MPNNYYYCYTVLQGLNPVFTCNCHKHAEPNKHPELRCQGVRLPWRVRRARNGHIHPIQPHPLHDNRTIYLGRVERPRFEQVLHCQLSGGLIV